MELPKGIKIVSDQSIPKGEIHFKDGNKTVGKIVNIECPVVEQYKARRGKTPTVPRIKPDPKITNVTFDKNVSLEDLNKQYVFLALQACNGSISQASRYLGIGKATIYRYLGKRY